LIVVVVCGCLAVDGVNGNWSAQTRGNGVRSINRDINTRKTPEHKCKDMHMGRVTRDSNGANCNSSMYLFNPISYRTESTSMGYQD
jgi:hypothetical protein